MSKHRTKAQKIHAAAARQIAVSPEGKIEFNPTSSIPKANAPTPKVIPVIPTKTTTLWRFSPDLVYGDLRKTIGVSLLIVGILVFIYFMSFS
jgi:hypothetical protein